eukprot:m.65348 g.65348  ORF g.65348 m.65348 type:complete len:510 (-) comp7570_c0_seq3:54-1583(-)
MFFAGLSTSLRRSSRLALLTSCELLAGRRPRLRFRLAIRQGRLVPTVFFGLSEATRPRRWCCKPTCTTAQQLRSLSPSPVVLHVCSLLCLCIVFKCLYSATCGSGVLGQTFWIRNVVVLVTNGPDQLEHWLAAHHHECKHRQRQSQQCSQLEISVGAIQAAVALRLHSRQSIEAIFLDPVGNDGQVANQDLRNAAALLIRRFAKLPVVALRAKADDLTSLAWIAKLLPDGHARSLRVLVDSVLVRARHFATSMPTGSFLARRIDCVGVEAVPGDVGGSVRSGGDALNGLARLAMAVDGLFRVLNNLGERFHHSFVFYWMTSPTHFLPLAVVLPVVHLLILAPALGAFGKMLCGAPSGQGSVVLLALARLCCTGLLSLAVLLAAASRNFPTIASGTTLTVALAALAVLARCAPFFVVDRHVHIVSVAVGLGALSLMNASLALVLALPAGLLHFCLLSRLSRPLCGLVLALTAPAGVLPLLTDCETCMLNLPVLSFCALYAPTWLAVAEIV